MNVVAVNVPVTVLLPVMPAPPAVTVKPPAVTVAPPADTVKPFDAVKVLVALNVPVTRLLPVTVAPPADTVRPLVAVNVPVTVLLPVIAAPPADTVSALVKVVAPVSDTVTLFDPFVLNAKFLAPDAAKMELDASAEMTVRVVPPLVSWISPSATSNDAAGDCVPIPTEP
jgi:hypothetical protein